MYKKDYTFAQIFAKMKKAIFILLPLLAVMGCTRNTTSATLSSTAQISAMYLMANDTFPGFAKAAFVVDERVDTGLIYSKDSILYGTPIHRAVVRFSYAATPSQVLLYTPDTVRYMTGHDTIDLTKDPMYVRVTSQDNSTQKLYRLQVAIHQVDPDKFEWQQLVEQVASPTTEQKFLSASTGFVGYFQDENGVTAYTSDDGATWVQQPVAGLPDDCSVRHILVSNDETYYVAGSEGVYFSDDGLVWESLSVVPDTVTLYAMLFPLGPNLWAVGEDEHHSVHAYYFTRDAWGGDVEIPSASSVRNFATQVFQSASKRERAIVIGGYDKDSLPTNSRLNFEYSPTIQEPGNVRITDYAQQYVDMDTLINASLAWYCNRLYLFGGTHADGAYVESPIYYTLDEGLTWIVPDSTQNTLPESFGSRQGISAVVKGTELYLFGGYNDTEAFSDVYRGKILSADW